jgi:thiosulfate reductase cytochrome b subunit
MPSEQPDRARTRSIVIHPLVVRLTHWLNAAAMVGMVMSGWGIYNASPLFDFRFPPWATLGGWLGGAIAWHLATLRLSHPLGTYNAVQRLAYLGVLVLGVLAVLSGLALWKPVQLQTLAGLMGGYEMARRIHFLAMAGIVGFVVLHLVLVVLVPRSLPGMLTGRARVVRPGPEVSP